MLFPFLTIFIIFILFLAYRYKTTDKKQKDIQASFWERENAANATPPVDLDSLSYITIPLEKFPLGFSDDENIISIENQLRQLSQKRILNLTGITNTEVKERYGVSNLNALTEIGENFDQLTILLKDYASILIESEHLAEAVTVLEFGVGIGTDIRQNYTMLGDCYKALGKTEKIQYLIDQVSAGNLMLAPGIIRYLENLS